MKLGLTLEKEATKTRTLKEYLVSCSCMEIQEGDGNL